MGAYLSSPVTDKESGEGEDDAFGYGFSAMQGWRTDMEDAHAAVLDLDPATKAAFFAVFDGHGGAEVARFMARHLAVELVANKCFQANDVERALTEVFLHMDGRLVAEEHRDELKSLRTKETEDGGPMVINGASLPDSLLEALGMPSGGNGFQIKLVRSGAGARGVAIDDVKATTQEEGLGRSAATIVDLHEGDREAVGEVTTLPTGTGEDASAIATGAGAVDPPCSKRKREEPVARSQGGGNQNEMTPEKVDDYQGPSAGCTAVCAVVRAGELYVANAGDSRCVLGRAGTAVAMTDDHKPDNAAEFQRIQKAGGFVADGRVNGSLNLSRALGDLEYKSNAELGPEEQMVTALPEVRHLTLQPGDEFLVLACDGIWDVLTNQEAVDFVRKRLKAGEALKSICEQMCDHCLAPDTGGCGKGCDNMSVVVVLLKEFVIK
ncbi:hypothetical protein D9Q98_002643 [Chlorella vulgaris]|uniref:protein-serine/threonine phosphatase n=1 Tax=Chlorella vulgaris TaxID=3077 RepID=A0A9D4YZJ6_CHLVU|nr:hypothetical protein D9Q98_002643 [Chlorella vulgaris]